MKKKFTLFEREEWTRLKFYCNDYLRERDHCNKTNNFQEAEEWEKKRKEAWKKRRQFEKRHNLIN